MHKNLCAKIYKWGGEKDMKKRTIALVALVFAVVVTAFSVSGTYARYATKQTGTDTARVAKWKVGEELTVNMFSESYLLLLLILHQ